MEPVYCNCLRCENILSNYEEYKSGICDAHAELLSDDRYYVGVCWECSTITYVGPRYNMHHELIIKDKYIFSKGCRACTGNETDNINWMTINKDSLSTSLVNKYITNQKILKQMDNQTGV